MDCRLSFAIFPFFSIFQYFLKVITRFYKLTTLDWAQCNFFILWKYQLTRMPYSLSVLLCLSQKIRINSVLAVFLKLGQMDFSTASNCISHHLTSIFPTKKISLVPRMSKMTENAQNHRKCQKSPKMPKIIKNAKNHRKRSKYQKWSTFEGFSVTCVGLAA